MRRVILLIALFPSVAFANSGNVGGAVVTKGKASVEARVSADFDHRAARDERLDTRIHYDYGFTDSYALRLIATQARPGDDNFEHSDMRMEHRFQLFDQSADGFDGGFRLEYVWEDGANKADQARIRFAAATRAGLWSFRSNLFFKHDIGAESETGIGSELRLLAARDMGPLTLGLEGFHNFGNLRETTGFNEQSHQLGLMAKGALMDGLSYQTGYQRGISDAAPDHSVKLFLIHNF